LLVFLSEGEKVSFEPGEVFIDGRVLNNKSINREGGVAKKGRSSVRSRRGKENPSLFKRKLVLKTKKGHQDVVGTKRNRLSKNM